MIKTTHVVVFIMATAYNINMEIGAKAMDRNPMFGVFEMLIGEWQTESQHPQFPGETFTGRASFEWLEGGAFVVLRSMINHPDFPDGIEIFGSDDTQKTYRMFHFDERGVGFSVPARRAGLPLCWCSRDC